MESSSATESAVEANTESPEYSYTQRNEFTSEIYKIEVKNLRYFGIAEFKKFLKNQFSLEASKIKSPKRRDFAYVCFRNQADQEKAISSLDGYVWKGKKLKAIIAKAIPDPLVKRRREQKDGKNDDSKKCKTAIEATSPLSSMPYEEQLKLKEDEMKEVLKELGRNILKVNSSCKRYFNKDDGSELPCKFLGIKPSPKTNRYRNKSELAIGKNSSGEITVGFRLGCYADGSVEVGPVDDLPQIPDEVKKVAKSFENFIKSSEYKVFNPENNSGQFRQLSVRSSEMNGEIMIIVGVCSKDLTEDEVNQLKNDIKDYYDSYDKSEFNCTSLYYQEMRRREAGQMQNPAEHLSGSTHIYDRILDLKFRISPQAFFQVNTLGAEVLYQEAIRLSNVKRNTTVLDICCGTGTIGLCFAKHSKKVIGVDIVGDAIKDAEFNANENGIRNAKFYTGNADDFIYSMMKEAIYSYVDESERDILAIVDPPRAGLHNKSILALRSISKLNRFIYISCDPKGAQRNWIDLARPESKTYKGAPFLPKVAVAVDMFPHTSHTELIILFERIRDDVNGQLENSMDLSTSKNEGNGDDHKN